MFQNTIVKVSKVDCTKSGAVCEKHGIRGYPTLLFFYNGEMVKQYDRQRTIDDFTLFVEEIVEKYEPAQLAAPSPTVPVASEAAASSQDPSLVDIPGEVIELNEDTFAKFVSRKGVTFVVNKYLNHI